MVIETQFTKSINSNVLRTTRHSLLKRPGCSHWKDALNAAYLKLWRTLDFPLGWIYIRMTFPPDQLHGQIDYFGQAWNNITSNWGDLQSSNWEITWTGIQFNMEKGIALNSWLTTSSQSPNSINLYLWYQFAQRIDSKDKVGQKRKEDRGKLLLNQNASHTFYFSFPLPHQPHSTFKVGIDLQIILRRSRSMYIAHCAVHSAHLAGCQISEEHPGWPSHFF